MGLRGTSLKVTIMVQKRHVGSAGRPAEKGHFGTYFKDRTDSPHRQAAGWELKKIEVKLKIDSMSCNEQPR